MKSYKAHVTWTSGDGIVAGTHGPLKVKANNNLHAIQITTDWCIRRNIENVTTIKVEEV